MPLICSEPAAHKRVVWQTCWTEHFSLWLKQGCDAGHLFPCCLTGEAPAARRLDGSVRDMVLEALRKDGIFWGARVEATPRQNVCLIVLAEDRLPVL